MFDIGWSELVIIGVVALIAIGPKELPGVLRTVGQYMGKIRRMASEFQSQFQEAMREAEMADLKKSVDEMTETANKSFGDFDPLGTVRKEIDSFANTDPLKDTSSSPEAASPETPAPVAEAPIADAAASVGAVEAPQAHEPPQAAEPQPKSGSGA